MSQKITLGNGSIEEKLRKAERIFQNQHQRINRSSILLVPPCLIAAYVEKPLEDGMLFSILLPVKGTVRNPSIYIGSKPDKDSIVISISMESNLSNINVNAIVKHSSGQVRDTLKVQDMTLLSAHIAEETTATKFWFSALYSVGSHYMSEISLIEE